MNLTKEYDGTYTLRGIDSTFIADITAMSPELDNQHEMIERAIPQTAGSVVKVRNQYYMRRTDGCWTNGDMEYFSNLDIVNMPWEEV